MYHKNMPIIIAAMYSTLFKAAKHLRQKHLTAKLIRQHAKGDIVGAFHTYHLLK